MSQNHPKERIARCMCGSLSVTARSNPTEVYICSCTDCQRLSGSAFSYCAMYPETNVSITGDGKTWRYHADSGRWIEPMFCPTCGCLLCYRTEASPELVAVSAGCFADSDFPKPDNYYFASRRHHWMKCPDETAVLDTQPD